MINWKVRFANKNFWMSFIPAILLLAQLIVGLFGVKIELGDLGNKLLAIIDVVFAILSMLGVVVDPTTSGTGDSKRAMTYETPFKDE